MIKKVVLFLLILALFLTGCGKSVQVQISEQLELGEKYLAQGDYEQAIVVFNKVIELDPKVLEAYEKSAEACIKQNNLEQAYSYVEQAFDVIASLTEEEKRKLESDAEVTGKLSELCEQILQMSLMDENADSQIYYEILVKLAPEKAEKYVSAVREHAFKKEFRETYAEKLQNLEGTLPEESGREDFYERISWLPEMSELLHENQMWEVAFKLNNGKYLMITDSQSVYYGDMQDRMRTGWGIWAKVDSTGQWYYAGEWEDDYPNGTGTYTTTEQEKFTFVLQGLWNHGIENGQMHLTVSEGERELFKFLYTVDDEGMPVSGERDPVNHGVVSHDYVALYRNGDEYFFCPLHNFPHCVFGLNGVDGGYMWNYEMGGYPAQ
mgnify:FL=1